LFLTVNPERLIPFTTVFQEGVNGYALLMPLLFKAKCLNIRIRPYPEERVNLLDWGMNFIRIKLLID